MTPNDPNNQPATQPGNQPAATQGPTQAHAADAVRQQIDQIYGATAIQASAQPTPQTGDSPYQRTHQENFDWRQYHSAWQQYYQEYYKQYYNQAKPAETVVGQDQPQTEALKNSLHEKIKQQARAVRRSNHFVPVISALAVGLGFLFLQFNSVIIARVSAYVSPGKLEGQSIVITDPTASLAVSAAPRVIVPKINVDVPVDYGVSALDDATVQVALREGLVHYKLPGADSLPGQFGNAIFLGHSSNDIFASGKYKFALVLADQLNPGDTFYVHYQGTRYTYKVTEKKVVNPDDIASLQTGYSKPMATLVTCTPPGTTFKRLLVFGEQISPDPTNASEPEKSAGSETGDIPGNAPTLIQRFLDLF